MNGHCARDVLGLVAVIAIIVTTSCVDRNRDGADVVIALPSSNLVSATVFVAEDLGLFQKAGLRVTIRNIVGVGSVNAVIAGSADFTLGTGSTLLRAVSQGQQFLAIANIVDRPMVELVLRRDTAERLGITNELTVAERGRRLKGLTLGIQGVGSIVHAWARYVVSTGGLDIEQDVRIAPMDPPAMAAAMQNRLIDGYASSPPFTTEAVMNGEGVMLASGLADAPELIPFPYLLVYAKPDTCIRRAEVCRRLVRALVSASRMVHQSPDAVLERVLKRRYPMMDEKLLRAAWIRTRQAHAADVTIEERHFANAQKMSLIARLLDPSQALTTYDGLYTNEFAR